MGLLVPPGWVRGANTPTAYPRETMTNQTVSNTEQYSLIDKDTVQVNGLGIV